MKDGNITFGDLADRQLFKIYIVNGWDILIRTAYIDKTYLSKESKIIWIYDKNAKKVTNSLVIPFSKMFSTNYYQYYLNREEAYKAVLNSIVLHNKKITNEEEAFNFLVNKYRKERNEINEKINNILCMKNISKEEFLKDGR